MLSPIRKEQNCRNSYSMINKINRVNNRFVALYEGMAYWFMMKDQYLFQVTTEREFFEYIGSEETPDKLRYTPTNTGFLSLKGLLGKRRYFVTHPINKEGNERKGVDLIRQAYGEDI